MKLLPLAIKATLIYLCTFQLAFAQSFDWYAQVKRKPAGYGHDLTVLELRQAIALFKESVQGKDLPADCNTDKADALEKALTENSSPFEMEDDATTREIGIEEVGGSTPVDGGDQLLKVKLAESRFQKLLKDIKKNACGEYRFTWDKNKSAEEVEECKPVRQKGIIENIVDTTMREEKEEKRPTSFRVDDPLVRKLYKRAKDNLQEVRKYMEDSDFDAELRRKLLAEYIDGVVMPMRALIVVRRAYMPGEYDGEYFYNSLLPEVPTSLFPSDDIDARKFIQKGINPQTEPWSIIFVEREWGRSQLEFDPNEMAMMDIKFLIKAPTKLNYVRALKWLTLHMMLSQVFVYDSVLGNQKPVPIPRSCQNHFNGQLPANLKFKYKEGKGQQFMESMLSSHGLTVSAANSHFLDYYLRNIDKDPTKSGFSGLAPFEKYKNANMAVGNTSHGGIRPDIEDRTYFGNVMQTKSGDVHGVFHDNTFTWLGLKDPKYYTYNGEDLWNKIVELPRQGVAFEVTSGDGKKSLIDPARQNLSAYLVEIMQKNGIDHYSGLISKELRSKFGDKRIKIDFPSLYGSNTWRQWAMRELMDVAETYQSVPLTTKSNLGKAIYGTCRFYQKFTDYKRQRDNSEYGDGGYTGSEPEWESYGTLYGGSGPTEEIKKICASKNPATILGEVRSRLKEFRSGEDFVPIRRLDEANYKEFWWFLKDLWKNLRDGKTNTLAAANPKELDYLLDQMESGNPWARTKLGHLVALEELKAYKGGFTPTYSGSGRFANRLRSREKSCFKKNVNSIIEKIEEVGKVFNLHRPLRPHHGGTVLNYKQKKEMWNQIIDNTNEGNSHLFTQEYQGEKIYKHMEELSFKTLLTRNGVEDYLNQNRFADSDEAREGINKILTQPEAKLGKFFLELYKLRGQTEKQEDLFQDFSLTNGIDNKYLTKFNFLILDSALKKPIYKSMIQKGAFMRRAKVMDQLNDFCQMEPGDHDAFKVLFYSTTSAQNQLNQMMGLPSVPADVMDYVQSMSSAEKTDMLIGFLSAGLMLATVVIGSICTGVSAGACAPLSVAMIGAAWGALGTQVALVKREYDRKQEADENVVKVKTMEKLGFSRRDSYDGVSRSWFWTIFETISIIPLLGIVARGTTVGTKLAVLSVKNVVQRGGKEAFKATAKRVIAEADVSLARYVLGFRSTFKDFGVGVKGAAKEGLIIGGKGVDNAATALVKSGVPEQVVKGALDDVDKIRFMFKQGRISMDEMIKQIGKVVDDMYRVHKAVARNVIRDFSKQVVKETVKEIDEQAAEIISKFMWRNPKKLQDILGRYSGKLDKAIKTMKAIEEGKTFIGKIPLVGWAVNGYRKIRLGHLAKMAPKVRGMEKAIEIAIKNGTPLDKFLITHMDTMTDIFMKIPALKREFPYLILLQGGPHLGGVFGRRLPSLLGGALSDGLVLRKFFNARARLVYESMKSEARASLGLARHVGAETTFQAYRAFQGVMEDAITNSGEAEAKILAAKYNALTDDMTKKLYQNFLKTNDRGTFQFKGADKVLDLSEESLRRILFSPKDKADSALGAVIWESMPVDDLFEMRKLGEVAHRVVKKLGKYKTVDEFDDFLKALKILTIHREPGVVEFM
ncbi:MAG: hypothetical protein HN509_15500 [Halobacteriovoraceae bacterium]|nr:hypothetical protein [Halobacteriovoraceae bacterium]MBT5092971.1 hypothetical protein [Halobacteriovoraceae bacterium]